MSFFDERRKELGIGQDNFIQNRKMDLGIIPDTRPKPVETMQPEKKPFLARAQKSIYDHTLGPIQDAGMRFASKFTDGLTGGSLERMSQDVPESVRQSVAPILKTFEPAQGGLQKTADIAGGITGTVAPYLGAYGLASKGLKAVAPKLAGLKKVGLTGVAATTGVAGAREIADASFGLYGDQAPDLGRNWLADKTGLKGLGDTDNEIANRLKRVGFEGLIGGAADVALVGGGKLVAPYAKQAGQAIGGTVKNALDKLLGRSNNKEAVEQLLLMQNNPRPNSTMFNDRPTGKRVETPDVIYGQGKVKPNEPLMLNAPELNPTTAKRGFQAQNTYAQKLERLFEEANNLEKQGKLTPGRELEEVESLWSSMAGPRDPSLDELINLATKPRTFSPDALSKGRSAQTAGAGPNVNSTSYKPFVGESLAPKQKLGKSPLDPKPIDNNLKQPFLKSEPRNNLDPRLKKITQPARAEAAATLAPKLKSMDKTFNRKANDFEGDGGETLTQRKTKEEALNPFLENSDDWKNKWTPALKRETMERNFDDIMGKDAPKMKEEYLEPIKSSEATRTRFLDKNRNEVKNLGIKFKSKDDKLVQQYGEKVITLDELKSKTNNWQQVVKAADTMRAKYDELFDTLNKALTDNGYDAVPKRKDYFPHYEEIDNMFTKLGFDIKNFELPTEIIGRTQNFKPGKNYFANLLRRKGDKTDYGFIEGFDRYIEGASRVIHHTENIKKLRSLENDIRAQHGESTHLGSFVTDLQDYTNNLSGKQSAVDRGVESAVGRGVYSFMDGIRRRVSLNMIGANLGSAMTNFIPVTHSLATNNKKAFAEGLYDAVTNIFKNDGFVKKSDFLTRRYGSDRLAQNNLDKAIDKSMVFMRGFDRFASNIIVRSKFKEGLTKGLSEKEAMKQADNWAAKIMADRSLGQMPTYFNSKSMGPLIQFQLEVNNQLSFLLKDIPRNMNKKQVVSALGQAAVYAYLYNEAFEKIAGRRVALDPIGLAVKAFEDYTNPEISKGRASANTVKGITDQLPFTSTFTGGRIPMSAAFPNPKTIMDKDFDKKTIGKELLKPAFYLLPPTSGGQVKKTYEGLTAMGKNPFAKQEMSGLYQENPKGEKYLKYPIKNNLSNNLKAATFGKYSTPETEEYYGNNRRALSPQQTKKIESVESSGGNTNRLYNNMQIGRRIDTLETKIKDIKKDRRLTLQEKQKEVEKMFKLIKELRESRVR